MLDVVYRATSAPGAALRALGCCRIGWVDVSGAPRVVLALGGQIFRRGRPVIGRGHISEARWSSVTLGAVRGEVDALGVL
jgi:hypothetical protein